ncbi:MAG: hypothetical protein KIS87_04710, partial [Phycisphaeraceae bacterium]|nr:hypothetical protein [Phycisphaeraceae bacterium]
MLVGSLALAPVNPAPASDPPCDCDTDGQSGYGYCDSPADFDDDGQVSWQDVVAWFWASQECAPNVDLSDLDTQQGRQTAKEGLIDMMNLWIRLYVGTVTQSGDDPVCLDAGHALGALMGAILGELPDGDDLDAIDDIQNPCDPPTTDDPDLPDGPGPFWCAGLLHLCNPDLGYPFSVTGSCNDPGCDIWICQSEIPEDCEPPELPEDIELPTIPNPPPDEPNIPPPGDGPNDDQPYPPPMFPPGVDPNDPEVDPENPFLPSPPRKDDRNPSPPDNGGLIGGGGGDDGDDEGDDDADDDPEECESQGGNDSGGGSTGGGGSDSGGNNTSEHPISIGWGHKIERAIDLKVPLKGRDFYVWREYTSMPDYNGPNLVGNQWFLSLFKYIWYDDATERLLLIGPTMQQHLQLTDPDEDGVWTPSGPSNHYVVKAKATVGEDTWPVWRYVEPGRAETDYYRPLDDQEDATDPPAVLVGLPLQERDHYGNTSTYKYTIYGTTQVAPRLTRVYLNGYPGSAQEPEAEIVLGWYLDALTFDHILHGQLGRISVVRRDGMGQPVETQRVEYSYKHDDDGFSDDLGLPGDLIQVTKFKRVDAWDATANDYYPQLPHRVSITQYRYHDGTTRFTDDPRLDASGFPHQLKAVFRPAQIDFAAQKLHYRDHGAPSLAARDTAYRLMLRGDDAVAFHDYAEPGLWVSVADLASKWMGYDLAGLISEQYIQSDCGCAGTQALRQTYDYIDWDTTDGGWDVGDRTFKVTETLHDGSDYNDLHRIVYYDMEFRGDYDVPYLVNRVVEDADGKRWVWHYEYDTDGTLVEEWTPSAVSGYTPAATDQAPAVTAKTGGANNGLVHLYEYTAEKRRTAWYVQNGTTGTPILKRRVVYPTEDDDGERTYLPSRREWYRVEVSDPGQISDQSEVEVVWHEYGFRGDSVTSRQVAWIRDIVEAELPAENGPAGGLQHEGQIAYERYHLYDERGQLRWIRRYDNVLVAIDYDDRTGRWVSRTYNADPMDLDPLDYELDSGTTQDWGYEGAGRIPGGELTYETDRDFLGRAVERRAPGGVRTLICREWRRMDRGGLNGRPGASYFTKTVIPHKLDDDTFNGPARVRYFDAGGLLIAESRFTLNPLATYDRSNVEELLSAEIARRTHTHAVSGLLKAIEVWHDVNGDGSYRTEYAHDALGRTSEVTLPNGTVARLTGYDVFNRALGVAIGTGAQNMTTVEEWYYDHEMDGNDPEQGVGNGNLSYVRRFTGEGGELSAEVRDTVMTFDHRDRRVRVVNPAAPHEYLVYDNQDRVVERALFDGTSGPPTAINNPLSERGLYVRSFYGQRGRLYRRAIAIDPTAGSPT